MTAPALPSATVMLVRDAPRFEVLMVRRHHQIEFASGALVFPGGKVEPDDSDPAWERHVAGWADMEAPERALRICAIREAYEESGILPDRRHAGVAADGAAEAARRREAVARGETSFRDLVVALDLALDLSAMTLFAHWVTPAAMPKRFDTRFYLMTAPADQIAACDGYETVDAEWIAPGEALRLGAAGERTVLFPTRLNLGLLAEANTVAEAVAAARTRRIVAVEPSLERTPDGMRVSIPADVGYGLVPPQRL